MQRYLARRLILGALTGFLVSVLIFSILRIAPGDVAMMIALEMAGGEESLVTEDQLSRIREDIGLNQPTHHQYLIWMGNWLTGDWGESMFSNEKIWDSFKSKLPVTLQLVIMAETMAICLGLPSGIIMALRRDTWIDYVVRVVSLAGFPCLPSGLPPCCWRQDCTCSTGAPRSDT